MRKNYPILLSALLISILWIGGCGTSRQASKNQKGKSNGEGVTPQQKQKIDFFYVEAATQYVQGNVREAIGLYGQVLELDPENHAAMYNIGKLFFELGEYNSAATYAQNALKREKDNFWYYGLLSDSYERLNEFDKAIETLEQITTRFPDDYSSWFNLAQLYVQKKKYTEAIAVFEELEKKEGINEEISFRKHQLYMMQGEKEKAYAEIQKLIEVNPYNPDYYQVLYDMYVMDGEADKAMGTLEKMLEIDPGNGFAMFGLADHYKAKGNQEKSDEYLFRAFRNPSVSLEGKVQILAGMYAFTQKDPELNKKLEDLSAILYELHPNSAKVFAIRGDIFRQNNEPDSARHYYRKALEVEPASEAIWQELLFVEMEEQDFPALKKDSEDAMEYFPDQPLFLYFNGLSSSQMNEPEEAIFSFERIKKIGTTNLELLSQVYYQLAELYHVEEQHSKSDENFDLALEMTPGNPTLLNNYAYYLSLRRERLEDAEKMSKKALEKEPENSAFMDTYGWILYELNRYAEAEKWIQKSFDRNGSAEVAEHLGDVWLKLGDQEKALKYWKKAQEMGAKDLKIDDKLNTSKANQ